MDRPSASQSLDDGTSVAGADRLSIPSQLPADVVSSNIARMLSEQTTLGPANILGVEPRLSGRLVGNTFRLFVSYRGPGTWTERSTWRSVGTGSILSERDGSILTVVFANPRSDFLRIFGAVFVGMIVLFTAFAALLLAAGAEVRGGSAILFPVAAIILLIGLVGMYRWGASREAKDRQLVAKALTMACLPSVDAHALGVVTTDVADSGRE